MKIMKNTANGFLIIVFLATFFLVSCVNEKENIPENHTEEKEKTHENEDKIQITKEQFQVNNMKFGHVEQKEFSKYIQTNGLIGIPPKMMASVSPVYGGYVQSINLIDGQYVKKGQVLFTMQNPDYLDLQRDYLSAKEKIRYLKEELDRQKSLFEDQISSQKVLTQVETDYNTAKAKFQSLTEKLKLIGINPELLSADNLRSVIHIRSPLSGYVSDIQIEKGEFLEPARVALKIINMDHMHVEMKIYEKDISKIHTGQKFVFYLPNNASEVYQGEIFKTGKYIDPEERFINVHGHIEEDKKQKHLLPGMFVEVKIKTGLHKGQALPETAVLEEGDKKFVLKQIEGNETEILLEKIAVETGIQQNGYVEILKPVFSPEDKILIEGGYFLIGMEEGGGDDH